MAYDPLDPSWPNRDRFVLSNGHACALLYSMLHLTGYVSIDSVVLLCIVLSFLVWSCLVFACSPTATRALLLYSMLHTWYAISIDCIGLDA